MDSDGYGTSLIALTECFAKTISKLAFASSTVAPFEAFNLGPWATLLVRSFVPTFLAHELIREARRRDDAVRPRPAAAVIPGVTRHFVTDTSACSVVLPTSATLGGTAISSSDFIQRYMLDAETLSSTPPSATAQLYATGVTLSSAGTIKDFTYDDDPPWPGEPDGTGYSLVLNHPASNPNHNLPQSWRASLQVNGTPGAAAGPSGPTGSAAAALADTDGDGMSDLIEYATGTLGNNGASQHWPTTGSMSSTPPGGTAGDYLTFSYTRSRSADGFTFEPEVSTALTGWMPLSTLFTFVSQMNNADGTATLKWRSTLPAAALPSRIFLQVRAGITP